MPDGKNEAKNSTMNLTIDMGNTRVKYAVFDGGTVVSDGCSEEFDEAVIDRILVAIPVLRRLLLRLRAVRSMTPSRWCVAASGAVCGSHRNFLFPFVTVTLRPKLWVRTVLRSPSALRRSTRAAIC